MLLQASHVAFFFLIHQIKSPCSEDNQIIFLNFHLSSDQEIKIPQSSFQTTANYCNDPILYYLLLLSDEQVGETWEACDKVNTFSLLPPPK